MIVRVNLSGLLYVAQIGPFRAFPASQAWIECFAVRSANARWSASQGLWRGINGFPARMARKVCPGPICSLLASMIEVRR